MTERFGLVWSAVFSDAEDHMRDPVRLASWLGPVVRVANNIMDDITGHDSIMRTKLLAMVGRLFPEHVTFDGWKHKLWEFLTFIAAVDKTCSYLHDEAGAFFEGEAGPSKRWTSKTYPSHTSRNVCDDVDDSIKRFLGSSPVVID
jgi:hypothetical protein